MIWQHVRVAMLAGGFVAAAALSARAEDPPKPAPGAPAPADCAPQYRTVCVNEWVPETYTTTRTVYEKVCKEEKYTAYRCECAMETRPVTRTIYDRQPVCEEVVRKICVRVPCEEERTVMQRHVTCKPVTRVERKCVDKGHYECKEVPCGPSFCDRLKNLCHHNDCCEPECCAPPRTKTARVWVPCPVWEEHTVTCMKRVCEYVPVKCKVRVCKEQFKEERCKVTTCKCVPRTVTETCQVQVQKQVPYQATRQVVTCVPREEKVTCTHMVCRQVEKKVPVVAAPCETAPCCESACCKQHFLHGLCGRFSCHSRGCCD